MASPNTKNRVYETPVLTKHGNVATLTRGANRTSKKDNNGVWRARS